MTASASSRVPAMDFYPRPPCGGRQRLGSVSYAFSLFLSTSPLRGTTDEIIESVRDGLRISIHVPLAGDDMRRRRRAIRRQDFYPRPPCGGRPCQSVAATNERSISIHVPLAGDDPLRRWRRCPAPHFYPRPPCGGRLHPVVNIHRPGEFLSTSPLRGTTPSVRRSPAWRTISIHVPLAGDDTPSVRRSPAWRTISIHVPLAGDDRQSADSAAASENFYPRPPCGGRRRTAGSLSGCTNFYPRPPCGGRHGAA